MRLVYQFQGQKLKVTRPSNAHTHHAPYFPNGKDYELQTWYTDGGRRPTSSTGAITYKFKGQGCKVTWSVWAILAQSCTCVISGRQGHTVSAEPGDHISCFLFHCFGPIVYHYNGALCWEQLLQVRRLDQALILLGLAFYFPSTSVSSVFMVLSYMIATCYVSLGYIFFSVFYVLALWDWPLTQLTNHCPSVLWRCWLGHVTCNIIPEMTYIMCWVGR